MAIHCIVKEHKVDLIAEIKSAVYNQEVVDEVVKRMQDKKWLESPVSYLTAWKNATTTPRPWELQIMMEIYHWQQTPQKLQAIYPFGRYEIRVDTHKTAGTVYYVYMRNIADAPSRWYNEENELVGESIPGNLYALSSLSISMIPLYHPF